MIRFKTGDILAEDAEALVNTVNCVGVMGRGVALQFRKAFPENFRAYAKACAHREVRPGRMFVFETGALTNPRFIINFPTKRHWRGNSRIEDIDAGLQDLATVLREYKIRSVAVPPLGSGLGGLAWRTVRPRIVQALRDVDALDVILFKPHSTTETKRPVRSRAVPKMTTGRAALIGLMNRYLNGLLDPFISLLEVYKLMYFMQIAGEPLKLKYKKGDYGPYAENLRHLLHTVEGHFISGYGDGGDKPDKRLELVPGAVEDAETVLRGHPKTQERFDRVCDLVYGFESAFGLELLSTVHWVCEHDAPASMDALIAATYAWNKRKQRFSHQQIHLAADILSEKGWIDSVGSHSPAMTTDTSDSGSNTCAARH